MGEKKLKEQNPKLKILEQSQKSLESRVEEDVKEIRKKIDETNKSLEKMEFKMDSMGSKLEEYAKEIRTKIDETNKEIRSLDKKIGETKTDISEKMESKMDSKGKSTQFWLKTIAGITGIVLPIVATIITALVIWSFNYFSNGIKDDFKYRFDGNERSINSVKVDLKKEISSIKNDFKYRFEGLEKRMDSLTEAGFIYQPNINRDEPSNLNPIKMPKIKEK